MSSIILPFIDLARTATTLGWRDQVLQVPPSHRSGHLDTAALSRLYRGRFSVVHIMPIAILMP